MKKATDYLNRTMANSGPELAAQLGEAMRADGVPHSPAQYDENGHCLTCGYGFLCPGVHTLEEIQEAGRRDNSPAGRGETFTVPTGGIANTDPMNMTKRNFEAWFACLTEGPEKDAIRTKRNEKEAWARKELDALNQPIRRNYFGANGPTGHGDICHSDADPGL